MNSLVLWIAQGFGIGRIRWAPGTWGSVLGLGWFALLLCTGNIWLFALGTILGFAASVWFCGRAEKILDQVDPPSVVLDEVTAMPACFALWVYAGYSWAHALPGVQAFIHNGMWVMTAGVFLVFRLFDIWKPWPVRQSQSLPGGWGVTVDDFLAAVYVNICWYVTVVIWMRSTLPQTQTHQ
jgi:phosphatidylglycerophosphatase A